MSSFVISGFSDEIDSSVVKQFEYLKKLDISCFEPRGIDGKNIADLTDDDVNLLETLMDQYGISASSIGSPIGKISITDSFEPHFEKFKRVCEIAHSLSTSNIRMFSFFIPQGEKAESYRNEVLDRVGKMALYATTEDIVLLHENEKDIYGDTADRCLDLLKTINSNNLRAVFDPANFVQVGQETLSAYEMLAPYIEYMHIKDAKADGTVVPAGHGIGNVKEIITRLDKADYNGFLSLEPHLGSFEGLSFLELDDKMEKLEKSDGGLFELAYNELINILKEV